MAARKVFRLPDGGRFSAVDGVSLDIEESATVALTGSSGAGKSTLLHLFGALERLDGGTIEVAGHDVGNLSRRGLAAYRRSVGFVFQRFHLLSALTAVDNVAAPVLPFRTGYDPRARARELLELVGLADRADALPSRLSGGQQQRVAIARALINRPRLLLADEPTGNLDSRTSASIMDLLLRLRDECHTTVVIATHDPIIAARCDVVHRLCDGQLERAEPPSPS
nr:ABC transporter ATP-binding protein [Asanoa siamensis]